MISFTRRGWWVFLPACMLFAIAVVPLFLLDLWDRLGHHSEKIAGAGMGWGLMVSIPAAIGGFTTLIAGTVAFFLMPKRNSKVARYPESCLKGNRPPPCYNFSSPA